MIIPYHGVNYHIQDTIERMHVWWNETGEAMANMRAWHYEACVSGLVDLKYIVRLDYDDFILCPETAVYMCIGEFFRAWGCACCDIDDVMIIGDDGSTVGTFPSSQDTHPSDEECISNSQESELCRETARLSEIRNHFVELRALAESLEDDCYNGDVEIAL